MSLIADDVHYEAGGRALLRGVSLRLQPGQVHALLGANGAGKSTLLRLLARELRPQRGNITLNGQSLDKWTPQALARVRAVLPQGESLRFGFTAQQVVELGRLPCAQHAPEREQEIVSEALHLTDAARLATRIYPTLSGGERQRVQLARVLVQIWDSEDPQPRYLLLDEPTASLDLRHQHDCLRLARDFARQRNTGVLVVMHDPNLALAYADEVSLLVEGKLLASGIPGQVITPKNIQLAYGVKAELVKLGASQHSFLLVT